MKSPVTLESLLVRVKKEVAAKEKSSELKKQEAKLERIKRLAPQTVYQREDLWYPYAIHREYEIQHCDSCQTKNTVFSCERIEMRHKADRLKSRWIRKDRGEAMLDGLPQQTSWIERTIPECYCCWTIGNLTTSLWKGKVRHEAKVEEARSEPSAHPRHEAQGSSGQIAGDEGSAVEERSTLAPVAAPQGA